MAKHVEVKLTCSFCDKNQREVKKLIAGPGVYICDECVGLCNQIIGEELSPEDRREFAARSAQGIVGALVAQQARVSGLLNDCAMNTGSPLPESMRQAITQLATASRGLQSETVRWSGSEPDAPAPPGVAAWLEPCLDPLSRTADALRTLRPALETLVPGKRLTTIDQAIGSVLEVRGLVVSLAEKLALAAHPAPQRKPPEVD